MISVLLIRIFLALLVLSFAIYAIFGDKMPWKKHMLNNGYDEIDELATLKIHKTRIGFNSVVMVVPSYKKDFSRELFRWCRNEGINYKKTHVMSYEHNSLEALAYVFSWDTQND